MISMGDCSRLLVSRFHSRAYGWSNFESKPSYEINLYDCVSDPSMGEKKTPDAPVPYNKKVGAKTVPPLALMGAI